MKKGKKYSVKEKQFCSHVSDPVSEYGTHLNIATSQLGCCTIDELHVILDRAEKNFSKKKGICHKDALEMILSW